MFGLFRNSPSMAKVIDKVWMSSHAKWNACVQMASLNPEIMFVAWFSGTLSEMENALSGQSIKEKVILARDIGSHHVQGRMIVFLEHYPLATVEQALYQRLNLKEVPVLSSLDEPFFARLGDKTIEIMKKLGMKEGEVIGHSMITRSIRNVQEAIRKKSITDHPVNSQAEWLSKNIKA